MAKEKKPSKKKEQEEETPKVHEDLGDFDIKVDTFGEVTSNYDIDKINEFLDKKVDDKKLKHKPDRKKDDDS